MKPLTDLNTLPLPELYHNLAATGLIDRLLRLAHDEDLVGQNVSGDITSICWSDSDQSLTTRLILREPATIAGLATLPDLCTVFAPDAEVSLESFDGAAHEPGAILAEITGPASQILSMERPMLNLISRLSGIATLTGRYAALASPSSVLDTRKTTPGLRVLEKYAVRCGGGLTHRMGLHDAVLLKDNHLATCAIEDLADRVRLAAKRARADRPIRFVEIEVDTLDQLERLLALEPGVVDIILLDNMAPGVLGRAVQMRDASASKPLLEASGGVSLDTIASIAASGVDRISIGALTHGATSVDIGLDTPEE